MLNYLAPALPLNTNKVTATPNKPVTTNIPVAGGGVDLTVVAEPSETAGAAGTGVASTTGSGMGVASGIATCSGSATTGTAGGPYIGSYTNKMKK